MKSFAASAALMLAASTTVQGAATIFDDDHEFMKGFETGVMMRSSQKTFDDFGCTVPDDMRSNISSMLDNVVLAIDGVKVFLPDDLELENGFDMVRTYVEGMSGLAMVMDPKSSESLDDYCRGMIFGKEGAQVLFDVSKVIRHQDKS